MSALLYLTADDFSIQKGLKGDVLSHSIPGFSLVLFYSTQCVYCQNFIPIFKKLPGTVGGCQFGMVNISTGNNKRIVQMSNQTNLPIKFVPFIVLYVNGNPFMIYKGPSEESEIRRFIVDVANNIQKKQQFTKGKVVEETKSNIPEYTIGVPVKGDKKEMVCYIEFGKFNSNIKLVGHNQ